MIRRTYIFLPLFVLLSCGDNFIGDPGKNIDPNNPSITFPSSMLRLWYNSAGDPTYLFSGNESLEYAGAVYTIKKITVDNAVYKVITYHSALNAYYTFYFKDISATGLSAYRSGSFASQSNAEAAGAGTYSTFLPTPGVVSSIPSNLVKNWYTTGGVLTYTITSATVQYSGTSYTVIVVYQIGSVYKVIAKSSGNIYYAFFFSNVSATNMSAYRSGGSTDQLGAEIAPTGTSTAYVSTTWTSISYPSTLNNSWYTSGGTFTYLFYESGFQVQPTISTEINTVTSTHQSGTTYRVIVRRPNLNYIPFFFSSVSSSSASISKGTETSSLSNAQSQSSGTYVTYTANWQRTTMPSSLTGNWYTSSNVLNYINTTTSIQTNNIVYSIIAVYVQSGTYKVVTKLSSSYYTFYFNSITSSQMYVYRSASLTTHLASFNASLGSTTYHKR